MDSGRLVRLGLVVAAAALFVFLLVELGVVSAPWTEDRAEIRVLEDGEPIAVIDAAVADTIGERYTGLSEHDSLAYGEGMLFVHGSEGERTYVMRGMSFDIDIVFVGSDREITAIEHARAPGPGEDGSDLEYTGRAKYVLEVPRGYANETGIDVGDELEIEYQ
ncbi:DUF192 domain-containing protein [Halopiger goleimassiliensis]|uniref:DUF192 domain-containing protein n=1 Tax=Halopiger goleimassiliensis TaxID=1293048 RepID=UPI0006782A8E|nr:DUF192 domain-containing protein [Halopiger goleimassiliensis]